MGWVELVVEMIPTMMSSSKMQRLQRMTVLKLRYQHLLLIKKVSLWAQRTEVTLAYMK